MLKQEIRKEQLTMDSQCLQSATNVVAFCKEKKFKDHEAYLNARRDVSRYFHLIRHKIMD
jgi:hypothetical protein